MDLYVSYISSFNIEVTAPKLPIASQKSIIKIVYKVSMLNICHHCLFYFGSTSVYKCIHTGTGMYRCT